MHIEDPRNISNRLHDTESQHAPKLRAGESVARNRLGGGGPESIGQPEIVQSASSVSSGPIFEGVPAPYVEEPAETNPLVKGLASLFGPPPAEEAPPTAAVLVQRSVGLGPLDNIVMNQPQMASALALGGVIAGCAVGALTLGLGGALLTFAFEAIAFAGGVLVSRAGQKQLLETTEKLLFDATHDGMTGLLNRKAVMDELEQVAEKANRGRGAFALLLTDVDHFKKINDTYGHQAGDEVLKAVAGRVRETIRQASKPGRYGGEEFLIVMPDTQTEMAYAAAERIRKSIASDPVTTPYGVIPVTVSIGVAANDRAGGDPSRLLRAADEALYRAKNGGRNRVEVALRPV